MPGDAVTKAWMSTLISVAIVSGSLAPGRAVGQGDSSSGTISGSGSISITTPSPYTSPYIGVAGTATATTAACPAGKIVIGLAGSRLKFIQKITPVCAVVNKDGSFSAVAAIDPGAITTSVFRLQCTPGHVVTRVRVAYVANTTTYPYLGAVEIGCTSWLLSQWSGVPQPIASTGFDGWPVKASVACTNQTQPMRALRVRATTAVKMLGIVCSQP
jgi:hypothetical protein